MSDVSEPPDEPDTGESRTLPDRAPSPWRERGVVPAFELTVIEGPGTGASVRSAGAVCTIGSAPPCDLVVADPMVSRFHCEVRADRRGTRVRDTESLNGTFVDGVRVVEAWLRPDSTIRIGKSVVRYAAGQGENRLPLSEARSFGQLVGESAAMRHVFALLERTAAATATLLLEGETGTGKSAAARAVHGASGRRGPFVMIDCGAIPANLLESELFGHERGAFTGADARRVGAFEEAGGGTLFLDEIGELPTELQPKLLGALENRAIRRVGGTGTLPVDVRVIAATNRDLRGEINAGRFRADLYFRLAVVRVEIPPLRQRAADLPVIAAALLVQLGADPAQIARLLAADQVTRMQQVAWPGNLRELRNYLERCLVFDEAVPLSDEPDSAPAAPAAAAAAIDASQPFSQARDRAIAAFEQDYLAQLLARHGGKVAEAAAAAEIDRTYFYRLLRRHRIKAT